MNTQTRFSSPLPWFRLYTEFATDPKVQLLSESLQRRFIMLLCLAGSGVTPTRDAAAIGYALRLSPEDVVDTQRVLMNAGLIDGRWFPRAWERRQRPSDHDAAERKRRSRRTSKRGHHEVTTASRDSHDADKRRVEKTRVEETEVPTEPVEQECSTSDRQALIERVFTHWQQVHGHPRAKLDATRRRLIATALDAYGEDNLCQSISGYRNSPHHMGRNERATVYDDIGLLLRDNAHIDAGLRFYTDPPGHHDPNREAASDWLDREERRDAAH